MRPQPALKRPAGVPRPSHRHCGKCRRVLLRYFPGFGTRLVPTLGPSIECQTAPAFPERFASLGATRVFISEFVDCYNHHPTSDYALLPTPLRLRRGGDLVA